MALPTPRRLVLLLVAVALLLVGVEAYRVAFGSNFHTVVPCRVYRCAQPSAAAQQGEIHLRVRG